MSEISYRISDRLSMKLGSYMGYGSIEYETGVELSDDEGDGESEARKLPLSVAAALKCHLPILIGARYEFYSSDSIRLGSSFGVGASIWSVCSRIDPVCRVNSKSTPWSDFATSIAGTAGLDLELKLSETAHLGFAFSYSLLGDPSPEIWVVGVDLVGTKNKKQKFAPGFIHGLNGAIGISFKF